jgi:hypothetical protein
MLKTATFEDGIWVYNTKVWRNGTLEGEYPDSFFWEPSRREKDCKEYDDGRMYSRTQHSINTIFELRNWILTPPQLPKNVSIEFSGHVYWAWDQINYGCGTTILATWQRLDGVTYAKGNLNGLTPGVVTVLPPQQSYTIYASEPGRFPTELP